MMMIGFVVAMVVLGLFATAYFLWQMWRAMQGLVQNLEAQQKPPVYYTDLSRQVSEIHQTMGGVINGLKAVGNQVHHLNQLAGYALQGSQADPDDENAEIQQQRTEAPQIMIQIRQAGKGAEGQDERRMITPDEMPPEMLEKFKTFQAVYQAILANPDFPSRKRPDLN